MTDPERVSWPPPVYGFPEGEDEPARVWTEGRFILLMLSLAGGFGMLAFFLGLAVL